MCLGGLSKIVMILVWWVVVWVMIEKANEKKAKKEAFAVEARTTNSRRRR